MDNEDTAYLLLRFSGGVVMLLMSMWKVTVPDWWIDRFMPAMGLPVVSKTVLFSTAVLGILLAGMMLFDYKVATASFLSFVLLLATEGLILVSLRPDVVGPFVRNIGLLGVYSALFFLASSREPNSLISVSVDLEDVEYR